MKIAPISNYTFAQKNNLSKLSNNSTQISTTTFTGVKNPLKGAEALSSIVIGGLDASQKIALSNEELLQKAHIQKLFNAVSEKGLEDVKRFFNASKFNVNLGSLSKEEIARRNLLKQRILNSQNERGRTPLFVAAFDGKNDVVRYLAEQGTDVNILSDSATTAFEASAHRGHIDVMQTLLDFGANIDGTYEKGGNALYWAQVFKTDKEALPVVEFLVEKGANVNALSFEDCTPLDEAIRTGNLKIAELLKEHGAKTFEEIKALKYKERFMY